MSLDILLWTGDWVDWMGLGFLIGTVFGVWAGRRGERRRRDRERDEAMEADK